MIKKLAPVLLLGATAYAQDAPLAQLQDDQQLTETITAITQDPAIKVDDEKARGVATALMTEGVHRLSVQAYDQALANFLEAYNRFPSPKILLNIASTLHDMGRKADSANTYQRYLADPATGPERVGEVKELLIKLDSELTILTVHVTPHGSDVSIDAGPFVPVGSSLQLRVRPGTHTVRLRRGNAIAATDLNSFEGETRDVQLAVADTTAVSAKPPEQVQGWLVDGRTYGTSDGNSRQRRVHDVATDQDVKPYISNGELDYAPPPDFSEPPEHLTSGVTAIARIDGNHWKGFAGGFGLAYAASDTFEVDLALLKSEIYGAYVGARYLFTTGLIRPYLGVGLPLFFFNDDDNKNQISIGGRVAAGLELRINGHLSVNADLGLEHFFNVDGVIYNSQTFEATTFAPTLGVTGRL
ncbi:hypothetical protein BH11MYX1_BH11MYX1_39990 [soil metagenome]